VNRDDPSTGSFITALCSAVKALYFDVSSQECLLWYCHIAIEISNDFLYLNVRSV
jgi:hypothetical protein